MAGEQLSGQTLDHSFAEQPEKYFDLTALGEAMVEFNQTQSDSTQHLQGFGGDTCNTVIAAARAGARTAYLTRLGADAHGQLLRNLWATEQVNSDAVDTVAQAPTGIYFVSHGQLGHAFSYQRAGSAATTMTPAWLAGKPAEIIRHSRWLHLSGISLAISPQACDTSFAAMKLARTSNTLVSFDSNLRLKLWSLDQASTAIDQAIGLCDLFLPSLEDMITLSALTDPDSIVDWSHAHGARLVVLKLGAQGALVSDSSRRERVPGHAVRTVDATGAGDCFCGNLLARLAMGDDLFVATRYANCAASLAVQGWGDVTSLPTAPAVYAAMGHSTL